MKQLTPDEANFCEQLITEKEILSICLPQLINNEHPITYYSLFNSIYLLSDINKHTPFISMQVNM